MKRKLNVVFVLIALAITGIIIFQAYFTINAYRINKQKFDANINIAMQRAMDDCKRDYLDSIRRVLVRHLSPAETVIKIDTLAEKNSVSLNTKDSKLKLGVKITYPVKLNIRLSNRYTRINEPFVISTADFNAYQAKIGHDATVSEILTEISFDNTDLMNNFSDLLGVYDIQDYSARLIDFINKHHNSPLDSMAKFTRSVQHFYDLPPGYEKSNLLRLRRYLKNELFRMNISSPFGLLSSKQGIPHFKSNIHYSETLVYAYKYQGFALFNTTGPVFYVRAVFHKPQYAILKSMLLSLGLSVFLMLFTVYCFYYITRTIMAQKKLADLKDDFINNMTHELKTPIATISVALEGLQKFNALNDPEKTQRYLHTSRTELARLSDLVTKVLDIAAFENKEIELVIEKINIGDLVNEVIQSEKSKTEKPADISFNHTGGPEFVFADKVHFRNVLGNLIDNAVKYSYQSVQIVVSCYEQGENLMFSVRDNGIGIPASQLGHIFEKFHRVPTGNLHAVKGTGLGLSYVKYIVEAHGGSITVKSEPDKGSEFIVSIPLTPEND